MRIVPGHVVQNTIAELMLGRTPDEAQLGGVTLHAHQTRGAAHVRRLIAEFRGALVADDVGLGKTFLALAVARDYSHPLVISPANLREPWEAASAASGVRIAIVSVESLSRGSRPAGSFDFIVIDEAQHVRNPRTRAHAAVRSLCARTPTLLLSATPLQNRVGDLRALLSLFLGERAMAMDADQLAAFIVRRERADVGALPIPDSADPKWLHPETDVDCLDRLLSLPSPLPAADADEGGVLLTYTLVRQWASSRAALRAALSRRIARAFALEDSLAAGRLPTRAELAAWAFADGAQQLAFPWMASKAPMENSGAMFERVRAHREAAQALKAWLETTLDPDHSRANELRRLMREHPDRRIVAFSEFSETVAALFRSLAPHARVAMLTHRGGRAVGGRLTRKEILSSFAPGARHSAKEAERIDLLLTTDVFSEGVGLHDASIVVHLDLPWNPARMAQRVGRVRRLGATESHSLVFVMAPPAPADRMLALEERLRRKAGDAATFVGLSGLVLPGSVQGTGAPSARLVASALEKWRGGRAPHEFVAGAVASSSAAVIACVRIDGSTQLLAFRDGSALRSSALPALIEAATEPVTLDRDEFDDARHTVALWLADRRATRVIDSTQRVVAQARRRVLRRVGSISKSLPRHTRTSTRRLLASARAAATAPLSAGGEHALATLARSQVSDDAWLRALDAFTNQFATENEKEDEILALLVLRKP